MNLKEKMALLESYTYSLIDIVDMMLDLEKQLKRNSEITLSAKARNIAVKLECITDEITIEFCER